MKRQALYACASCDTTGPAGVCLACSLTCHKDHELYELYTKRFEYNLTCTIANIILGTFAVIVATHSSLR